SVAQLVAAACQRHRHRGVEAGRDPEPPAHRGHGLFSRSATHSTWGVCGNMSTGLTRRSLYPASASWAAFGARVVGLHDTYTMRAALHSITRRMTFFERPARGGSTTTTSGRPARSSRGRIPSRASAEMKRAFEI